MTEPGSWRACSLTVSVVRTTLFPLSAWVLSVKLDGSPSGASEEAKSAMACWVKKKIVSAVRSGPLRRLYWLAVDAAAYALVAPSLNRVRAGLGLSPVRRVFRWWLSPDLVIGLFPGWYAAPQPDWPPQLRLAGFGRFDGAREALP